MKIKPRIAILFIKLRELWKKYLSLLMAKNYIYLSLCNRKSVVDRVDKKSLKSLDPVSWAVCGSGVLTKPIILSNFLIKFFNRIMDVENFKTNKEKSPTDSRRWINVGGGRGSLDAQKGSLKLKMPFNFLKMFVGFFFFLGAFRFIFVTF